MYLFDRSIRTKIVGIEKTELKEKLDIEGLVEQTKKVENRFRWAPEAVVPRLYQL